MQVHRALARILIAVLFAGATAGGAWYWWWNQQVRLPNGLVSSNGQIEADQVDISSKSHGRVRVVLVRQGDVVSAGQILVRLDTTELELRRAKYIADQLAEEARIQEAKANVAEHRAELALREANLQRVLASAHQPGVISPARDQAQSERDAARAALDAAGKSLTARERTIEAAKALVRLTDAQIADATLTAPVRGRVLYRFADPGEVVSAGAKILTIIDFSGIHLNIFLPSRQGMRVAVGSQARIQFAGADLVLPAKIGFVSPDREFNSEQADTEGDESMFRIKLHVSQALVERHIEQTTTAMPGIGYVRLDPNPPDWPEFLQKRYPGDPIDAEDW